jgi:hypothetical protein
MLDIPEECFLPNMLDIPKECQLSTKYVRYSRTDVSFLTNMLDIPEQMSAFYQIC